jgi:hypothetical protein
MIITLDFEENAIFCRKLSKIAENCDHNIDPWSPCLKACLSEFNQASIRSTGFLTIGTHKLIQTRPQRKNAF